jgi:DNA-binding response OmpR family regulator
MKILVVDDDQMMLESLIHFLRSEGYETVTANDGLKALEIAKKQSLDLIISDVFMPDFSGLNLLNMLKHFYLYKIPVILISAYDKREMMQSSLGLGADDFISKPINFDELRKSIHDHITGPAN